MVIFLDLTTLSVGRRADYGFGPDPAGKISQLLSIAAQSPPDFSALHHFFLGMFAK
jgi:hypothetical protein